MTLFASVAGVFGDILGFLILGITAVAIIFVAQLLFAGRVKRSQTAEDVEQRERAAELARGEDKDERVA